MMRLTQVLEIARKYNLKFNQGKCVIRTTQLTCLLDNNVEFTWDTPQERSWQGLKEAGSQAPVLKFFDPSREIKTSSDASQGGLGAVLLQKYGENWFPVAYASRALTDAETRYPQIEKEIL